MRSRFVLSTARRITSLPPFPAGFKIVAQRFVTNTIFDKRLHVAKLITAVMALAFHMISFNRFFLDQHINGVSQLNFITSARRGFASSGQISALRT